MAAPLSGLWDGGGDRAGAQMITEVTYTVTPRPSGAKGPTAGVQAARDAARGQSTKTVPGVLTPPTRMGLNLRNPIFKMNFKM